MKDDCVLCNFPWIHISSKNEDSKPFCIINKIFFFWRTLYTLMSLDLNPIDHFVLSLYVADFLSIIASVSDPSVLLCMS